METRKVHGALFQDEIDKVIESAVQATREIFEGVAEHAFTAGTLHGACFEKCRFFNYAMCTKFSELLHSNKITGEYIRCEPCTDYYLPKRK